MSSPIRPPLWITDENGNPSGRPINKIIVSEGTLSVTGTTATVTTGGSGGTGTVTNVSSTDTFVTITNPSTTPVIVIGDSSATSTGVLTSTDWSIFNAKGDGTVTSVTSTDSYVSVATDSTTPVITIGYASTSLTGVLTNTDWNTFNNKGSGDGTVTSVTSTDSYVSVATDSTTPVITIGSASTSLTGVLTNTDWNTFNNKTSNTGTVTNVQGALPIVSSGGTSPSISINKSATASDGYLSAGDWNIFNNKQATLSLSTTGTSGASTLVGSTLNIPQYSGAVTFPLEADSGSLSTPSYSFSGDTNTGMYSSSANTVNIVTGGSIRATINSNGLSLGDNTNVGKVSSLGTNNLQLETNNGSDSGTIVIEDGVNGQISLSPNGSGKVKLDGVEIDNSLIATNFILKATSATEAGWAAESGGGGGFTGSLADTEVAFGDTTADSIQGSSGFTSTLGAAGTTSALKFGYSDGTTNYTRLRLNGNNAYLEFRDQSDNQKGAIGFQSTQGLKFYAKAGGIGAAEAFRITPDDEWMLNGSNVGAAGDVLTSGGSAAAVTWSTPSGGGGFTGSLTDTELAFGDTTADSIQGSARLTFDGSGTGSTLTIGEAGTNYPRLAIRGNNGFINFLDSSNNATGQIGVLSATTGITFKTSTSNTERLRISGDGSFGLSGANYGTSGQVITSAGTGSPPTWTTVSGGGGGLVDVLPQTGSTSENQYNLGTTAPWGMGGNDGNASMVTMTQPFAFPFIAPETGTVTAVGLKVTAADSQNAYVAFYSQDSDNLPSTRLGYATIGLGATGDIYQTSITGLIALTAGTQYWYSINSDVSASATLNASQFLDGLPNLGICSTLSENGIAIKDNTATSNAVPPSSFTASFAYGNWNRVHVGIKY